MKGMYQDVASLFTGLALSVFAWNVSTPSNPDHILNLVEMGVVTVVSAWTYFLPRKAAEALQVLMLAVVAFLPFGGIQAEPFIGAFIIVAASALTWAYDGFRTRPWWKLVVIDAALLYFCAAATARFSAPGLEAFGRATMWVVAINAGGYLIWRVSRERIRLETVDYIVQNRKLLDLNKELEKTLAGGCQDAINP